MLSIPSGLSVKALQEKLGDYRFETYAYIVTITRADPVSFSILETEYKAGLPDAWKGREVSCRFRGSTFDMASGKERPLSALAADPKALREKLEKALKVQYGTTGLAGTESADYSWTADALGIRFYFNSDAVSKEKRKEIGDYSDKVITVALPYDTLDGSLAGKLSDVPEAYIARIDRETVYDLPHGDFSVMLTKNDAGTILRMLPDKCYYGEDVVVGLKAQSEYRSFSIILRNGHHHDAPSKITFYSEGLPATNEPSKQPPLTVYLTKADREVPGRYDHPAKP